MILPTGLHAQPGEQLQRTVAVVLVMGDFDAPDVGQGLTRKGVVKEAGDAQAELPAAGPFVIVKGEFGVRRGYRFNLVE